MAAELGINDFVAQFSGGGARPNLYKVTTNIPGAPAQKSSYLCKAATLPESNMGKAEVPFMGRKIYVAGDKEFAEWTLTFLTDTDMEPRKSLEIWLNDINLHVANTGLLNPRDYYIDMLVEQLDRQGNTLTTYKMSGCFPTQIGEITLAYDANDQVAEFPVTFSINYWSNAETTDQ